MSSKSVILIVEGHFYKDIADQLAEGMIAEIQNAGFLYERISVPGVFEVPAAISMAVNRPLATDKKSYVGYIASGCVIKGETDHYNYICQEVTRGIMKIGLDYGVPIGFGILTCKNREQAIERALVEKKNKGGDAAKACLRLIELAQKFGKRSH